MIAIVAKVRGQEIAADTLAIALVRVRIPEGKDGQTNAYIYTIPENPIAGRAISFFVAAPSLGTVDDKVKFTFEATITDEDGKKRELLDLATGVHDDASVLPVGTAVADACTFAGGVCPVLSQFTGFRVNTSGSVTIKAKVVGDNPYRLPEMTKTFTVARGVANGIWISEAPLDQRFSPICTLSLQLSDPTIPCWKIAVDKNKVFNPVIVDQGNNFLRGANASWVIEGQLAEILARPPQGYSASDILRPDPASAVLTMNIDPGSVTPHRPARVTLQTKGGGVLFSPPPKILTTPQTTGTVKIASEDGKFAAIFAYELTAGAPAIYQVLTERYDPSTKTFNETAPQPFHVNVRLLDTRGNLCTNYNTASSRLFETVTVTLQNASPAVNARGDTITPVTSFTESLVFNRGEAISAGQLFAPKATDPNKSNDDVKVNITSGALPVIPTDPFDILPGLPASLKLRSVAQNAIDPSAIVDKLVSWAADDPRQNEYDPAKLISLVTGKTLKIFASAYDACGNYVMDVPSRFDPVDGLASATIQVTSGTNTIIAPASVSSTGRVLVTPLSLFDQPGAVAATASPCWTVQNPDGDPTPPKIPFSAKSSIIEFLSGTPVSYAIYTEHNATADMANNIELAGNTFKLTIVARDQDGLTAAGYDGPKNINFVSTADPSWTGVAPVLPNGNVVCQFHAGICVLAGPFSVAKANTNAVVTATDLDNVIPDYWTTFIRANANVAAGLVIADKPGGSAAGAKPLAGVGIATPTPIVITADDRIPMAVAVVDRAGNFLSDAASASTTWASSYTQTSVTGQNPLSTTFLKTPALAALIPAATGSHVVFDAANPVGAGKFRVTVAGQGSLDSPDITVTPGRVNHFRYEARRKGEDPAAPLDHNFIAGDAVTLRVILHDADHNVVTSYNTFNDLGLTLVNHHVPPHVASMASGVAGDWGQPLDSYVQPNVSFLAGEALIGRASTSAFMAAMYLREAPLDGSPLVVKLKGTLAPKLGFDGLTDNLGHPDHVPPDTFTVTRGSMSHIHYMRTAGNSANEWGNGYLGCTDTSSDYCTVYNTDTDHDTGLRIYAHKHDAGCNFLGTTTGDWTSANTPIRNEMINPANGMLQTTVSGPSVILRLRKSTAPGVGSLEFTATDGTMYKGFPARGYFSFKINPGVVTHGAIVVNDGDPVVAGSPFRLGINLLDQFDNITGFGEYRNIVFTHNANPSPINTPPERGANMTNFLFVAGQYRPPTAEWKFSKAESVTVTATLPEGTSNTLPLVVLPTVTNTFTVQPAAATEAIIKDAAGTGGAIVGARTVTAGQTLNLYACSRDPEQNLVGCGVDADWYVCDAANTTTCVPTSAATISPSSGSNTVYTANSVGSTYVKMVPRNGLPAATTGTLGVGWGAFAKFQVTTEHGGNEAAGVPFTVTVKAVDVNGNWIQDWGPDEDPGTPGVQKEVMLAFDTVNAVFNEGGKLNQMPTSGAIYRFTNGVLTHARLWDTGTASFVWQAMPKITWYSAKSNTMRIRVTYDDGAGNSYTGSGPALTIAKGPAHHYVTGFWTASPSGLWARSDWSSPFDVNIALHDNWGNLITSGGDSNVTLTMYLEDGVTPAVGTLKPAGSLSGINLSAGTANVPNLAWDIGGRMKVRAQGALFDTDMNRTSILVFQTDAQTVKSYRVEAPSPITAGISYPWTIRALDNAGNPVQGADAALNALRFTWGGLSAAPNGAVTSVPGGLTTGTLSFNNGVAFPNVTTYRASTLAVGDVTLADNQATPRTGGNALASIVVNPHSSLEYVVTSDAATAKADPSGTFTLTVDARDQYWNPKPGDAIADVIAVRTGGSGYVGALRHSGGSFANVSLAQPSTVFTGVYYGVPHQVKFQVSNVTASTASSSTMNFTVTNDTAKYYSYGLSPSGSSSSHITAGENVTVTVRAVDDGGNVVLGIDGHLSARSFSWSGPGNAPSGAGPVYATLSPFTSGSATGTMVFKKAETIAYATVRVNDNWTSLWTGSARSGIYYATVYVDPAAASSFTLTVPTAGGTSQTAGNAFDVKVQALDPYNNPATGFTSDTLTFAWSGTSATPATPNSAGGLTATAHNGGSAFTAPFTSGAWQSTGTPFRLYRSSDTAVLQVTSAALGTTYNLGGFSIAPRSTVDYVKILDANTSSGSHVDGVAMTTTQTKPMWAHGYDQYGNWIGLNGTVTWSATNELAGKFSPTSGNATTLAPTLAGSGVVTATPAVGTPDSTGTIIVSPATASKVVYTQITNPTTADACMALRVQIRDSNDNPAPVASNKTINLYTTSATGGKFYSDSGCSSQVTTMQITSGSADSAVFYYADRTASTTTTITVAASGLTSADAALVVNPGATTRIQVTSAALNQGATACGSVAFEVRDQWNNAAWVPVGGRTFTLSSGSGTGSFYASSANCAASASAITSLSLDSGSGNVSGTTVWYRNEKGGNYTITVASTSPSTITSGTVAAAVTTTPGSLALANEAADGYINNAEKAQATAAVTHSGAVGYTSVGYALASWGTTCNGSLTYSFSAPPTVAQVTPDGAYVICAKVTDNAGSQYVGTGSVLYRDTGLPPSTGVIQSGQPAALNNLTALNVAIKKADVYDTNQYRYKVGLTGSVTTCADYPTGYGASWVAQTTNITDALGADGSYRLCIVAQDAAGNVGSPQQFLWTKDTVKPNASVTSTPSSPNNGATLSFGITFDKTVTGLTAGAFTLTNASSPSLSGSGTSYTLTVTPSAGSPNVTVSVALPANAATDGAGNGNNAMAAVNVVSDRVPPVFTSLALANEAADGYVNASEAASTNDLVDTLTASGNDHGTTPTQYAVWSNTSCSSATGYATTVPKVSGLGANGTYYVCVKLMDAAGNVAYGNSSAIVKDTVTPTAAATGVPTGLSNAASLSVTVSATDTAQYQVKVGEASVTDCASATGYSAWTAQATAITNANAPLPADDGGTGNVSVKLCLVAKDAAGNAQAYASATSWTWTKDVTKPTATISGAPSTRNKSTVLSGVSIGGPSDMGKYAYTMVAGGAANCPATGASYQSYATGGTTTASSITGYSYAGLADGTVTLCVVGLDNAGNWQSGGASATTASWTKDTTGPGSGFSLTAPSAGLNYTDTPTVTWAKPSDTDLDHFDLKIASDSGCSSFVSGQSYTSLGPTTTTQVLGSIADGPYYVCLWSFDDLGNAVLLSRAIEIETTQVATVYTALTGGNYYVRYISRQNGSWSAVGEVSGPQSDVVDPRTAVALAKTSEAPHVVYAVQSGRDSGTLPVEQFFYNAYASGSWGTPAALDAATPGSDDAFGTLADVAFASDGTLRATYMYHGSTNEAAKVATGLGSPTYDTALATTSSRKVRDTSLAIGSADQRIMVVAYDTTSARTDLAYLTDTGSGWSAPEVMGGVPAACGTSTTFRIVAANVALSSSDAANVAYLCGTNGSSTIYAYHAVRTGVGTWTHTQLGQVKTGQDPTAIPKAWRPSIALDGNGKAHIVYYDAANGGIVYGTNASGSFVTNTIATSAAGDPTLALDPAGKAYVFYRDNANNLKMTTNNGGSWSASTAVTGTVQGVGNAVITGQKGRGNR